MHRAMQPRLTYSDRKLCVAIHLYRGALRTEGSGSSNCRRAPNYSKVCLGQKNAVAYIRDGHNKQLKVVLKRVEIETFDKDTVDTDQRSRIKNQWWILSSPPIIRSPSLVLDDAADPQDESPMVEDVSETAGNREENLDEDVTVPPKNQTDYVEIQR
ncbi:hypothetical protein TNCV_4474611 [Trichonephila clavipes]|nr:hypothetical protein TNCV_4474611 [Trichonephila clavipes]